MLARRWRQATRWRRTDWRKTGRDLPFVLRRAACGGIVIVRSCNCNVWCRRIRQCIVGDRRRSSRRTGGKINRQRRGHAPLRPRARTGERRQTHQHRNQTDPSPWRSRMHLPDDGSFPHKDEVERKYVAPGAVIDCGGRPDAEGRVRIPESACCPYRLQPKWRSRMSPHRRPNCHRDSRPWPDNSPAHAPEYRRC